MPREGARNLIATVAKAMGKKNLNVNNFEDRLIMQKGCYILNSMGVGPRYTFGLYIRGPYSSDLADDYYRLLNGGTMTYESEVSPDIIHELSLLIGKGTPFLEAYATLKLALEYNPKMERDKVIGFVINMKPRLNEEIKEASEYLSRSLCAI